VRIVPLGTQIVTRIDTERPEGGLLQMAGAVAVILQMPSDTHRQYRVRFPDGAETCLRRTDFQVRKELAKTIGTALGVVHTTPEHEELKKSTKGCITRYHSHHYLGFAETQWKLLNKENPKRIKPLLYVYRVLLTGIHMMRTGEVEANLRYLNSSFKMSYLDELIARKSEGAEKSHLEEADMAFHEKEYTRLQRELEQASQNSHLPERPSSKEALNDLLVRVRLNGRFGQKVSD